MATSLIKHERIVTTVAKAKELRKLADNLIGFGKKGTVQARRQANAIIREKPMVTKLFEVLGPRYAEREGGYTRVMKIARFRVGDNAPLAAIEYVDRPGEIRAARPPKARRDRILAGGVLNDILEDTEMKIFEGDDGITPEEADAIVQDTDAAHEKPN
eukprot:CAMPEP_0197438402 /NCGR_PEP_ID=MMETSP1175-20131217/5416_1 /TAXON_ID=1003142 /ORGANISM="Triceratium dubium, Strain CCMP147" /LENGTH=157 /DNA_ID=CAMNT_0042968127 /DNA_START=168 /DNA_END=641 /DNA_ORIENTATION=+